VALEQGASARTSVNRAVEVSIHVGLAIMLVTACLLILRPFIPMVSWGIIIAVAAYPGFLKLQRALGGRRVLAAILFTLVLLAVIIVPAILLGQSSR
jgi:predicted PurR-regulated permease PerM